jgi:membrane protease YdiL (CAAX protease family)
MSSPDSNQDRQQSRLYEAARSGADEEKAGWPVSSTLSEIADVEDSSTAEDSDKLFYSGTAFEFALGGVALLFGKLLDMSALGAGFDLSPESIALGLLWTIPPCAFVYSIRFLELEELKEIEAITRDFTRRLFLGRPNLALALFCFGAGFGEELLFRGVLHQKLESLLGFVPAAAMVGLGFGASHNLTPAYFTISGLTSFIFSYMFASSGSNVVVPIVAHATYDYIALKLILKEIEELDIGK